MWVGNFVKMCLGYCVWFFVKVLIGVGLNIFFFKVFNGDVGVDGMCIMIVSMIFGVVINIFGNGYY